MAASQSQLLLAESVSRAFSASKTLPAITWGAAQAVTFRAFGAENQSLIR
jgi:hypothetical protein